MLRRDMVALWLGIAFAQQPAVFSCCDDPQVEKLVGDYLKLAEAVAKEPGKSPNLAYQWAGAVRSEASKLKNASERKTVEELAAVLDRVKNKANEIAGAFDQISRPILYLALNHVSASGRLELAMGACGDKPWLQRAGKPIPPYPGQCALR